jgi:hypothetical protein
MAYQKVEPASASKRIILLSQEIATNFFHLLFGVAIIVFFLDLQSFASYS